jgi:pSer/pThr/pTyr-binding forkhead associated (FHA) protein
MFLRVFESEIKLQTYDLVNQYYFIGRSQHSHIQVKYSFISNCHITLVLGSEEESFFYTAYDGNILGEKPKPSVNGLFVNRERINKKRLESGDIINFSYPNAEQEPCIYPYLEYLEDDDMVDNPTETHEFRQAG